MTDRKSKAAAAPATVKRVSKPGARKSHGGGQSRIAYQGEPGAFSNIAAGQVFAALEP